MSADRFDRRPATRFRTSKWGEQIDSADKHVAYLEHVQTLHPDRPNFRGAELEQSREIAAELRRQMKAQGKRRSDSFYGLKDV